MTQLIYVDVMIDDVYVVSPDRVDQLTLYLA